MTVKGPCGGCVAVVSRPEPPHLFSFTIQGVAVVRWLVAAVVAPVAGKTLKTLASRLCAVQS